MMSERSNNVDIEDVMGTRLPAMPLKQWLLNPYIQKLKLNNNFVKILGVADHNNEYVTIKTDIEDEVKQHHFDVHLSCYPNLGLYHLDVGIENGKVNGYYEISLDSLNAFNLYFTVYKDDVIQYMDVMLDNSREYGHVIPRVTIGIYHDNNVDTYTVLVLSMRNIRDVTDKYPLLIPNQGLTDTTWDPDTLAFYRDVIAGKIPELKLLNVKTTAVD
jgi:hypothetical protein